MNFIFGGQNPSHPFYCNLYWRGKGVGERGGGKGGGVFPPLCQVSISERSAHFLQYFHLLLKAVKGERASVLKFTIFVREKWSRDRLYSKHKLLTCICRVQRSVWRLPNYPLYTERVCPPPAPKAWGTHSPGGEGVGGVNISEDARHWIGLLQYNPSTTPSVGKICRLYNWVKNKYFFLLLPVDNIVNELPACKTIFQKFSR